MHPDADGSTRTYYSPTRDTREEARIEEADGAHFDEGARIEDEARDERPSPWEAAPTDLRSPVTVPPRDGAETEGYAGPGSIGPESTDGGPVAVAWPHDPDAEGRHEAPDAETAEATDTAGTVETVDGTDADRDPTDEAAVEEATAAEAVEEEPDTQDEVEEAALVEADTQDEVEEADTQDGVEEAALVEADTRDDADATAADQSAGLKPGDAPAVAFAELWTAQQVDDFRTQWREVQLLFVDDPHHATGQAGELISGIFETLSNTLDQQRGALDDWRNEDGDTERLRQAMRRYRDFFDRLLGF